MVTISVSDARCLRKGNAVTGKMENGDANAARVGARAVRHRPHQQPNAIADYVQLELDTLAVSGAEKTLPSRRRKLRKKKAATRKNGDCVGEEPREYAVVVRNMVDMTELEDDDEYEEILGDLGVDLGRFGTVVSLSVDRGTADVVVRYADGTVAKAAMQALHGRVYGGRKVDAQLQDEAMKEPLKVGDKQGSQGWRNSTPVKLMALPQDTATEAPKKRARKRRTKIKNAVMRAKDEAQRMAGGEADDRCSRVFTIMNMVDAAEVEDDDEFAEVLQETRETLRRYGAIAAISIIREEADGVPGEVSVEYEDGADARIAFDALDGKLFGGRAARCVWREIASSVVRIHGMLEADELEDDDKFSDVREEVEGFLRKDGGVTSVSTSRSTGQVTVTYETPSIAEAAVRWLRETMYGGRRLEIEELSRQVSGKPREETAPVAKLNTHTTAGTSEAMRGLIIDFLQRLASLQERAHVQNPLHDKRSRRLVLGLHEVKRGLASQKIHLLILATDVDECDVLDERLADILSIAAREAVPVIRAMTRRKLGRVLKKRARVSCVGVYSFDGANELYHEILKEKKRSKRLASGLDT